MDVSKNRGGPPKWMVKIMDIPIKMDDLGGFPPIFGLTPISWSPLYVLDPEFLEPRELLEPKAEVSGCIQEIHRRCHVVTSSVWGSKTWVDFRLNYNWHVEVNLRIWKKIFKKTCSLSKVWMSLQDRYEWMFFGTRHDFLLCPQPMTTCVWKLKHTLGAYPGTSIKEIMPFGDWGMPKKCVPISRF